MFDTFHGKNGHLGHAKAQLRRNSEIGLGSRKRRVTSAKINHTLGRKKFLCEKSKHFCDIGDNWLGFTQHILSV